MQSSASGRTPPPNAFLRISRWLVGIGVGGRSSTGTRSFLALFFDLLDILLKERRYWHKMESKVAGVTGWETGMYVVPRWYASTLWK